MTPNTPPGAIHWLGTISLGIIWGGAFMGMAIALEGFSPGWVAAGRLVFGGLTLAFLPLFFSETFDRTPVGPTPWLYVIVIGLTSTAIPFMLLSWGLQFVPSSFAGICMAAVALFILPMAHVFIPGERLTGRRAIGVVTGFIGVVVLFGTEGLTTGGDGAFLGRLACIAASFCYAVSSILTRRCPPIGSTRLTRLSLVVGAVALLPILLLFEGPPTEFPVVPVVALIVLGILPTGLANLIRTLLIRSAGPGFTSLVAYQVPVWAVIYGAVFLAEPVPSQLLAAMVLILGGIAITQWSSLVQIFSAADRGRGRG